MLLVGWKIPETLPKEKRQPLKLKQVLKNFVALISHKATLGYVLVGGLSFAGMFCFLTSGSIVYIGVYNIAQENFGYFFGLNICVMLLLTTLNGRFVTKIGSENMLRIGLSIQLISGLFLACVATFNLGFWAMALSIPFFVGTISTIGSNATAAILERYPMADYGVNSAKSIHYLAEAMKLAYADRSEYLGDPDFVKIPVTGLISKKYADELAQGISDSKVKAASEIKPGKPQPYESDQTTHFSVMDKHGNAVAVTYTLNFNFGSGIVAEGTGILLNDEMDDFSAKPGVPNAFGLIGGEANAIAPQKRPLSSMTPTLVMKDNKPWLVTGSPGGARIITTVLQSIVNTIDHKMNPAEAIVTPRVHHQWLPDELRIEEGLSPDTLSLLKAQGYNIKEKAPMGRVQIIQATENGFYGYSDPRNPEGKTIGY